MVSKALYFFSRKFDVDVIPTVSSEYHSELCMGWQIAFEKVWVEELDEARQFNRIPSEVTSHKALV